MIYKLKCNFKKYMCVGVCVSDLLSKMDRFKTLCNLSVYHFSNFTTCIYMRMACKYSVKEIIRLRYEVTGFTCTCSLKVHVYFNERERERDMEKSSHGRKGREKMNVHHQMIYFIIPVT